jgi:hypothetical protein
VVLSASFNKCLEHKSPIALSRRPHLTQQLTVFDRQSGQSRRSGHGGNLFKSDQFGGNRFLRSSNDGHPWLDRVAGTNPGALTSTALDTWRRHTLKQPA